MEGKYLVNCNYLLLDNYAQPKQIMFNLLLTISRQANELKASVTFEGFSKLKSISIFDVSVDGECLLKLILLLLR